MGDALQKKFENLDGRDDPMLQNTSGAISCRFLVSSSVSCEGFGLTPSVHSSPAIRQTVARARYDYSSGLCCHILTASCKIHALDWTRKRRPITRSKLAHEIARKLERYLHDMAVRPHRSIFNLGTTHRHTTEINSGYIGWPVEDWPRIHEH